MNGSSLTLLPLSTKRMTVDLRNGCVGRVGPDGKIVVTSDPNDYSDDPWYIVDLIVRLVRVSMKTQQIVQSLPTIKPVTDLRNYGEVLREAAAPMPFSSFIVDGRIRMDNI